MKAFHKTILILCFLIGAAVAAEAKDAEPSVRAIVNKKAIFIGDRIRYEIEVTSRKPVDVEFPKFPDYKMGDFEIKDSGQTIRKGFFGNQRVTNWYSITAYIIGKLQIPEAEVKYKLSRAKDWSSGKTKAIGITVESLLAKETQIKDIKDIKGPIGFFERYPMLIAALILALVAAASFFVYKKLKGGGPVKLPHETALEELEAIAAYLARTGDTKGYYVQVSDCIRHYIEKVFALKAPEMTTEEFLYSLKESKALSEEHKDSLRAFLNACDLVKFAKYKPTRDEELAVLTTARKFVEETKDHVHI